MDSKEFMIDPKVKVQKTERPKIGFQKLHIEDENIAQNLYDLFKIDYSYQEKQDILLQ